VRARAVRKGKQFVFGEANRLETNVWEGVLTWGASLRRKMKPRVPSENGAKKKPVVQNEKPMIQETQPGGGQAGVRENKRPREQADNRVKEKKLKCGGGTFEGPYYRAATNFKKGDRAPRKPLSNHEQKSSLVHKERGGSQGTCQVVSRWDVRPQIEEERKSRVSFERL